MWEGLSSNGSEMGTNNLQECAKTVELLNLLASSSMGLSHIVYIALKIPNFVKVEL